MSDEKDERKHKHYHFHLWPKISGDAWAAIAMFACIAAIFHSCFGG